MKTKNNRKQKLFLLSVLALVLVGAPALFFHLAQPAQAAAGINKQVNFQGKIVNTNGTNITDGTYNLEFKIYCGGDGVPGSTSADCTNGTTEHLLWTESRLRNNSQGVSITNGIFQVNLGSVTVFGGTIDWNEDKLWLSINVGNTNATCTPFSSCSPDGEMNPMIRLTAAPYALNADTLDGIDSTSFGDIMAVTAGAGIGGGGTSGTVSLDISAGNGITVGTDDVAVNQNFSFGWTADHTWTLVSAEDLAVGHTITGTTAVDTINALITNQTSSGTQRGLVLTNVDDGANAVTEALISLINAETTASTITDGLVISGTAGSGTDTIVDAIDVSDDNITNGINLGTNFLVSNGSSINNFAGNGLEVSSNAVAVDLLTAQDGSGSTFSFSGLEHQGSGSDELTLLQGCSDTQILKWDDETGGNGRWDCAADATGGGSADLDGVYDNDSNHIMLVDHADGLTFDFTVAGADTLFNIKDEGTLGLVFDNSNHELRIYEDAASPSNFASILATASDATFKSNSGTTKVGNGTGAITINAGAGAAVTITGHAASVWSTDAGGLTVQGGTTLTLNSTGANALTIDSTTTGGINIGTNANAKTIAIGNQTGATAVDISSGSGGIDLLPGGTGDVNFTLDDDSSVILTGSVTNSGFLQDINLTLVADADNDTISALNIDVTNATTGDADLLNAFNIGALTDNDSSNTITETAIRIGSGWSVSNGDSDLRFDDDTPVIKLGGTDNSGELSIMDNASTPNEIVKIKDLSTNFGGYVEAGAMIDRNSYFGDEFQRERGDVSVDTTANVWGDDTAWSVDETATSGDCLWAIVNDTANGISQQQNDDANAICNTYIGDTAAGGTHLAFDADNLPVMLMKVKPSHVGASDDLWVGLQNATTLQTNDEPDQGIFFTNDNASTWTGVVKTADGTRTAVACTSQTVSTTNFALLKIEVVSTSNVRFYVDPNTADGIQWVSCGSATTGANIPTAALTSMIKWTSTTITRNLQVDFFRVWQDDNIQSEEKQQEDEFEQQQEGESEQQQDPPPLEGDGSFDSRVKLMELMSYEGDYNAVDIEGGRLMAGLDVITPRVTTDSLLTNSIEATDTNIELKLGADGKFVVKNQEGEDAITFDSAGNATFAGIVTTDKLVANQIEGLELLVDRIGGRSDSQQQEDQQDQDLPPLPSKAAFTDLESVNLVVLAQIESRGGLVVDKTAEFRGKTIFKLLAEFHGPVNFKDRVSFEGQAVFNNDVGGRAVIKKDAQEVEIVFDKEYAQTPMLSASYYFDDSDIDEAWAKQQRLHDTGYNYLLTKSTTKGFTILLNKKAAEDIIFNWLVVPVKDIKIAESKTEG